MEVHLTQALVDLCPPKTTPFTFHFSLSRCGCSRLTAFNARLYMHAGGEPTRALAGPMFHHDEHLCS